MKITKFGYRSAIAAITLPAITSCGEVAKTMDSGSQPNVILILTDDQGYGDLGCTGNPIVKTPNIDRMAAQGIELTDFSVSPVSAPTRASLLTGRESIRTGVGNTYNGGTTMSTEEVTLAEILKGGGYNTAIFGKWHLGDNYPSRPEDQGFEESLIHLAGGVGQPGDFPNYPKGDSCYFNPVLWHNGEQVQTSGYCSDVYTSAAVDYIQSHDAGKPFFIYLAFNAPHTPLQVPEHYYDMYRDVDPSTGFDPAKPMPAMNEAEKEAARRVYGMVTNIDDNVGRVMAALEAKGMADNTLVIFMTDNGPEQYRYTGGLRERKGSVFQGGVKVPFFMTLPSRFSDPKKVGYPSAHIDIVPTLAAICDVEIPDNLELDGENILPQIENSAQTGDRTFHYSWTRIAPVRYRNMAIRQGDNKLVGNVGQGSEITDFELFDLAADPYEQNNIVNDNTVLASELRSKLDSWYTDIIGSDHLGASPAIVGSSNENPSYLNRNDALGQEGIWTQEEIYGYWDVDVAEAGNYDIKCVFIKPLESAGVLQVQIGKVLAIADNNTLGVNEITLNDVYLTEGRGNLVPWYKSTGSEGKKYANTFPLYVKITKK